MQVLIQKGVNVNTANMMGSMPIHEATFVNNISAMQLLISEGANANVINNIGAPLHITIITGAITTAIFLLRNRTDVDIRNNNLDTPLHWAVYNSDVITTTILLEANANINIRGLNGATSFELGEYFNNFEIRNLMWEQINRNINKNDSNICSIEKNIQQQQKVLFNHKRDHKQKIEFVADNKNPKKFKVSEISQRDWDEAGTSGVMMNTNTEIKTKQEVGYALPNLSEYTFKSEEMSEQKQREKENPL